MTKTTPRGRAETPAPHQQTCAEPPTPSQQIQAWIAIDFGYSDAEIHDALGDPVDLIESIRRDYLRDIGRGETV